MVESEQQLARSEHSEQANPGKDAKPEISCETNIIYAGL